MFEYLNLMTTWQATPSSTQITEPASVLCVFKIDGTLRLDQESEFAEFESEFHINKAKFAEALSAQISEMTTSGEIDKITFMYYLAANSFIADNRDPSTETLSDDAYFQAHECHISPVQAARSQSFAPTDLLDTQSIVDALDQFPAVIGQPSAMDLVAKAGATSTRIP